MHLGPPRSGALVASHGPCRLLLPCPLRRSTVSADGQTDPTYSLSNSSLRPNSSADTYIPSMLSQSAVESEGALGYELVAGNHRPAPVEPEIPAPSAPEPTTVSMYGHAIQEVSQFTYLGRIIRPR